MTTAAFEACVAPESRTGGLYAAETVLGAALRRRAFAYPDTCQHMAVTGDFVRPYSLDVEREVLVIRGEHGEEAHLPRASWAMLRPVEAQA